MPNTIACRLAHLGIDLSSPPTAAGAYAATATAGDLLFTSGQIAVTTSGDLLARGTLGADIDLDTGIACARQCAINILSQVAAALGDLERVRRVIKLTVFVASDPRFTQQPLVANGASNLINDLWGADSGHVRSAIGVAALPAGSPVEVEAVLEIAA